MKYRDDQKEIMDYEGGKLAIPSVPGAGKTFIATHLTAKIIKNRWHKPGKVLILTYMNSAVNNFKARIKKLLEEEKEDYLNDYEVMTIHSLATKIVKKKPDLVNMSSQFEIIDGITQMSFISNCIEEWKNKNLHYFNNFIDFNKVNQNNVSKAYISVTEKLCKSTSIIIGEFKNRELSPEKINKITESLEKNHLIRFAAEIYQMYTEKLKINGLLDYDDLLVLAYTSLKKDEQLKKIFQEKYTFIIEDEAQDSNIIQQKILELLSKKHENLIKVGDSNQAIMSTFTNSDPKLFKKFCQSVPNVKKMLTAGRSSRDIIDLANFFVNWVRKEHPIFKCRDALEPQLIKPVKEGEMPQNPKTEKYGIGAYETNSLVKEIKSTIGLSVKYLEKNPQKTLAILAPTGDIIEKVANELDKLNIEYDDLSERSKDVIKTTKRLGRVLEYLAEPYNNNKFKKMLEEVFLEEAYENKAALLSFIEKTPLENILFPTEEVLELSFIDTDLKNLFIKVCNLVKKILDFPQSATDKLLLFIAEKLEFSNEDKAIVQKIAQDIKYLHLTNPRWTLDDLAKELLETKSNRFTYFAKIVHDMKGYEPQPGRITLSTYHKSKGLEWDCVILVSLTNSFFPVTFKDKFLAEGYYFKDIYSNPEAIIRSELDFLLENKDIKNAILNSREETISEKIRLLYVAITRAKEVLILLSHADNLGRWNEEKPSQYFYVLRDYIEKRREESERFKK